MSDDAALRLVLFLEDETENNRILAERALHHLRGDLSTALQVEAALARALDLEAFTEAPASDSEGTGADTDALAPRSSSEAAQGIEVMPGSRRPKDAA